jgi:hypothetical protein
MALNSGAATTATATTTVTAATTDASKAAVGLFEGGGTSSCYVITPRHDVTTPVTASSNNKGTVCICDCCITVVPRASAAH